MSARQYKPFTHKYKDIPLIVYPVKDENPLKEVYNPSDNNSIQEHLDILYGKYEKEIAKGAYHILFICNLEDNRTTDVWIHDMKNWSDSGPLIECHVFRNLEVSKDAGIASGDSLIVLGREEELRRKIDNLEKYVDREKHMPEFPEGMQATERFYKQTITASLKKYDNSTS